MNKEVNIKNDECEENYYVNPLLELLKSHSTSITRNSQFLGYGILIALFHYGKPFFVTYPILACATALFSIVSLALIYIFFQFIIMFYQKTFLNWRRNLEMIHQS